MHTMTTRTVIARTPAGLPRTYRLVRRQGRVPAVLVMLKKLLA